MIVNPKDLSIYKTKEVVGDLTIDQTIRLHKPTGVFFAINSNNKTNEFMYFSIGSIDADITLKEKKSFDGITNKSFFEAVDYFEKLIEDKQPEQKQELPSFGKFYFIKGQKSFVILDQNKSELIYIEIEDLEKVFSPPKNKPFGRLNMLDIDKPQYDLIKAKFALAYNQEATDEFINVRKINDGDSIVYNMTPYSSNSSPDDTQGPSEVNDQQLTLDQIEDEKPEDLKGNKSQEDKTQEPQDKDEQQPLDEPGDEPTDESGQEPNEEVTDQPGEETQDQPGNEPGEETENQTTKESTGEFGQSSENESIKSQLVSTTDMISGLNKIYNNDIKYLFKKQERMLNNLASFNEDELRDKIFPLLNVDKQTTKNNFIELVTEKTKQYFES